MKDVPEDIARAMTPDEKQRAKLPRDPQSDWEAVRRVNLDRPLSPTLPVLSWLNIINALQRAIPKRTTDKNYELGRECGRLAKQLDEAVKDALASARR